ncbi:phage tail length tape measure family protein [Phyllobacterium endophyticum]|uniref:Bacteriophage tail tape measure N-terminal domain-containing protein n=1 Tax=Phyllobacterium endophyticum TaxID=1149773 RepID=A0A2P7AUX5_9HYPH|nr:phage tail length tape measure family protein [Phyllobacterium endophyticum]MBB3234444.1 hypothetical protein [Phyllobacterium endophyticum]PSH57953.1 hypothetical protein CU100_09740 [Phyllobacterium endophyticum]TYR44161.1 hypothetical protein FY050_03090 [Phyllobacterium endophyticum]
MPDIASLGVEARASGVDQTAKALDRLTGAAKRAEAATEAIGPVSSKAGAMASQAANAHATALNAEAAAAMRASSAMKAHATAVSASGRQLIGANANVANLAAQFQDIGVSAAMSMNPLQIALQQGTQIGAVLGPMGAAGALKSLGSAFLSIISPVSLATIGLVAAVAAGLQLVNWAKLGAAALVGLADSLQVVAPYAIGAAAALALLYSPAIIVGIVQVIALLGRLAVAATIAAADMIAANPGLAFILGIAAAVAAANVFRDELTKIFGVDIVKAAKDGVNALIATFVGAYQGIKATWRQLPAAIKSLSLKNAMANQVFSVGDLLSFDYGSNPVRRAMHRIVEASVASGAGVTPVFEVRPHFRVGVAIDIVVTVIKPAVKMRIVPGTLDEGSDTEVTTTLSFQARQTI